MIKQIIYGALWLSIGIISAIDIYWSIFLQEVLIETELNPIGKFLIGVSGGDIALFMFCKVVGLVVVLGILTILYHYRKRLAWAIILGVSIFQFWLLWYLNAAGPSTIAKVKLYQTQEQERLEAIQFPPTITPANPVDEHLKQGTDLMIFRLPAQNARGQNSNKSSMTPP